MSKERCVGSVITFTSEPNDGSATHSWNFGDGSPLGSNPVENHIYASAGTYTVTHTVTNNGCEDTYTVTINYYKLLFDRPGCVLLDPR